MTDNENRQLDAALDTLLDKVENTTQKTATAADIIRDIAKDIIFSTSDLAHQYSRDHGAELTPELYHEIRRNIVPTRNNLAHPQPNQDEL